MSREAEDGKAVFRTWGNILLKPITEPKLADFDAVLKKAKRWASETGLQESDIDDAIKAVRKKS